MKVNESTTGLRKVAVASVAMLSLLTVAACGDRDATRTGSTTTGTTPANTAVVTTAPDSMRPTSDAGRAVEDTALTAKVKAALLADPDVKGLAINVDTKDGVVSLIGKVGGQGERDKALQVARNVEGVRSVSDQLAVN
ncbi:MAG: BON domain-containing protein [Proteobacteria bacterium]|nr:BON domain-containing protein [Burkholderiales bacterium]